MVVKENNQVMLASPDSSSSPISTISTTHNKSSTNTINTSTSTSKSSSMAFSAVGSLIKLLPTGTVFMFQFLSPIFTNSAQCTTLNKFLTSVLLLVGAFCCIFSSFTDSYTDTTNNRRHYGIVTTKGLWPPPKNPDRVDLSGYRLNFGDFVHAALTLVVFAVLGLLDTNTVLCFYPAGFESNQKTLVQGMPLVVGALASGVFMVFPNTRHGIGYHLTTDSNDTSPKSNDGGAV